MGLKNKVLLGSILFSVLSYVAAQDYFELRHTQHMRTQNPLMREIPKKFEVNGGNPTPQFNKLVSDIQNLADKENVTVQYKVKVEVSKTPKKGNSKKAGNKKSKSMKFKIPLKKKNMRLSSFEIIMRKLVETNGQKVSSNPGPRTTEDTGTHFLSTTTSKPVLKYKPIIRKVRTNYAKKSNLIKPVKKQEITLNR